VRCLDWEQIEVLGSKSIVNEVNPNPMGEEVYEAIAGEVMTVLGHKLKKFCFQTR